MGIYDSCIVYPPEFDEIDFSSGEEDFLDELSPFELQEIAEYSSKEVEELLFYQKGEPICNL